MKPIHLSTSSDELRPVFKYVQVLKGFVHATDAHILIKLPIAEVFGEDVVTVEDELYFDGSLWAAAKMHKAVRISRTGNLFEALDKKGKLIGQITALTGDEFTLKHLKYPDVDSVLPRPETPFCGLISIAFNLDKLNTLCKSFGVDFGSFWYSFYATNKCVLVQSSQSTGFGVIMPINLPVDDLIG